VITIALAAALLAAASANVPDQPDGFGSGRIAITEDDGDVAVLPVWIADTTAERGRGLMGVTDLGAADGMLFVFDRDADWHFYMWRTIIPLTIVYFDADGSYAGHDEMEPCHAATADRCRRYSPGVAFRYALELPAGVAGRLGIGAGDHLALVPPSWWEQAFVTG
jgi:uncharacterized protein